MDARAGPPVAKAARATWVKVEKKYVFEGVDGPVTLADDGWIQKANPATADAS